jgi:hypothetical protein
MSAEPWNYPAAFNVEPTGGAHMIQRTVASFVAAVFALGMTTAVYAQTPAPKPAETTEKKADKPAEKMEKKPAKKEAKGEKKPAADKAASASAEKKKDEKPAEAKK